MYIMLQYARDSFYSAIKSIASYRYTYVLYIVYCPVHMLERGESTSSSQGPVLLKHFVIPLEPMVTLVSCQMLLAFDDTCLQLQLQLQASLIDITNHITL